jgi:branched-subunit amino acid ABC-type transport system permease component
LDFFLQFLFSGLTRGSIYALVGIGFAIVYNASHVINFAQGEFVMLGGMTTAFLAVTAAVLHALVQERFLHLTVDGRYARPATYEKPRQVHAGLRIRKSRAAHG